MRSSPISSNRLRASRCRLALSTALAGGLSIAAPVHAQLRLPTSADVSSTNPSVLGRPTIGSTTPNATTALDTGGNIPTLSVGLNATRTVIDWKQFDIPANQRILFSNNTALNTDAAVLNRVVGSGGTVPGSTIAGFLTSDSNVAVYLVNPSGILFGAGAAVNVGGLITSALDVDGSTGESDFINGNAPHFLLPSGFTAAQEAAAKITITGGAKINAKGTPATVLGQPEVGQLVLIGAQVLSTAGSATVNSTARDVAIVAADDVTLNFSASSPLSMTIASGTAVQGAFNVAGTIGGRNVTLALASRAALIDTLMLSGTVSATGARADGAGVVLTAASDTGLGDGITSTAGITGSAVSATAPGAVKLSSAVTANAGDFTVTGGSVDLSPTAATTQQATDAVTITATTGDITASGNLTLIADSNNALRTAGTAEPLQLVTRTSGAAINLAASGPAPGATLIAGKTTGSPESDVQIRVAAATDALTLGNVTANALSGSIGASAVTNGLARNTDITVGAVTVNDAILLQAADGGSVHAASLASGSTVTVQAGVPAEDTAGDITVDSTIASVGDTGLSAIGLVKVVGRTTTTTGGNVTIDAGGDLTLGGITAAGDVGIGATTAPATLTATDTLLASTGAITIVTAGKQTFAAVPTTTTYDVSARDAVNISNTDSGVITFDQGVRSTGSSVTVAAVGALTVTGGTSASTSADLSGSSASVGGVGAASATITGTNGSATLTGASIVTNALAVQAQTAATADARIGGTSVSAGSITVGAVRNVVLSGALSSKHFIDVTATNGAITETGSPTLTSTSTATDGSDYIALRAGGSGGIDLGASTITAGGTQATTDLTTARPLGVLIGIADNAPLTLGAVNAASLLRQVGGAAPTTEALELDATMKFGALHLDSDFTAIATSSDPTVEHDLAVDSLTIRGTTGAIDLEASNGELTGTGAYVAPGNVTLVSRADMVLADVTSSAGSVTLTAGAPGADPDPSTVTRGNLTTGALSAATGITGSGVTLTVASAETTGTAADIGLTAIGITTTDGTGTTTTTGGLATVSGAVTATGAYRVTGQTGVVLGTNAETFLQTATGLIDAHAITGDVKSAGTLALSSTADALTARADRGSVNFGATTALSGTSVTVTALKGTGTVATATIAGDVDAFGTTTGTGLYTVTGDTGVTLGHIDAGPPATTATQTATVATAITANTGDLDGIGNLTLGKAGATLGATASAGSVDFAESTTLLGSAITVTAHGTTPAGDASVAGKVTAGGDYTVHGDTGVTLGNTDFAVTQAAGGNVLVTANGADIRGLGALTLQSDSLGNGGGTLILDATNGTTTTAGAVNFDATTSLQGGKVETDSPNANASTVGIRVGQNATGTAGQVVTLGTVSALTIAGLDSTGAPTSALSVAGPITLAGQVSTYDSLSLTSTGGSIETQGITTGVGNAATQDLTLDAAQDVTAHAPLDATGTVSITARGGAVSPADPLGTASLADVTGGLGVDIAAGTVTGNALSTGDPTGTIEVHAYNGDIVFASADAASAVTLEAAKPQTDGTLLASGDVRADSVTVGNGGAITIAGINVGGRIVTGGSGRMTLSAGSPGTVAPLASITINGSDVIGPQGQADLETVTATGAINVTDAGIDTHNVTSTVSLVNLLATNGDLTTTNVSAGRDVTMQQDGDGEVFLGGTVDAGTFGTEPAGSVSIVGQNAVFATGAINAANDVRIDATGGGATFGLASIAKAVTAGGKALASGGVSRGVYTVTGGSVELGTTGQTILQQATDGITIRSTANLTGGDITGKQGLTLASNSAGDGTGDLTLHSAANIDFATGTTLDGGTDHGSALALALGSGKTLTLDTVDVRTVYSDSDATKTSFTHNGPATIASLTVRDPLAIRLTGTGDLTLGAVDGTGTAIGGLVAGNTVLLSTAASQRLTKVDAAGTVEIDAGGDVTGVTGGTSTTEITSHTGSATVLTTETGNAGGRVQIDAIQGATGIGVTARSIAIATATSTGGGVSLAARSRDGSATIVGLSAGTIHGNGTIQLSSTAGAGAPVSATNGAIRTASVTSDTAGITIGASADLENTDGTSGTTLSATAAIADIGVVTGLSTHLATATAGHDLSVTAGSATTPSAGTVTIGTATATNGALTLASNAGGITVETATAGTDATLTTTGATGSITVGTLDAGSAASAAVPAQVTITSVGALAIDTLTNHLGRVTIDAAGTLSGRAAGARTTIAADGAGSLLKVTAGDTVIDTADAGGAATFTLASLDANRLSAADALGLTTGGSALAGTLSGSSVTATIGTSADFTTVSAGGDIAVTAGSATSDGVITIGTATAQTGALALTATHGDAATPAGITLGTGSAGGAATITTLGTGGLSIASLDSGLAATTPVSTVLVSAGPIGLDHLENHGGSVAITAGGSLAGRAAGTRSQIAADGAAGDLIVTAGDTLIDTATAGGAASFTTAALDANSLSAGTTLGLATTGLRVGDATAGGAITATTNGGNASFTTAHSGGDLTLTAGATQIGTATAGGAASYTTTTLDADALSAGTTLGLATTGFRVGDATAGGAITAAATGGDGSFTTVTSRGGPLTLDASGVATISGATSVAGDYVVRAASIVLGGAADSVAQSVGGKIDLAAASGSIAGAKGLALTAGGTATLTADGSGGKITLDPTSSLTATGLAAFHTLGKASLGAVTVNGTNGALTLTAADAELAAAIKAGAVTLVNGAPTTLTWLGGPSEDGSAAFRLTATEINRIAADQLTISAGTGAIRLDDLTLDPAAGRTLFRLLTSGNRIDVTGKLDASGSTLDRTFQIGGTDAADARASVLRVAATQAAGGRLLLGQAVLDLRADAIGVGLDSHFLDALGATPGGTPISGADATTRFVSQPNSTLYNATLLGDARYTDPTLIQAGQLIVHYADYALFQNTGSVGTDAGVVIGATTTNPVPETLQLLPASGTNAFALFGTINGFGDTNVALLGSRAIVVGDNTTRANSRANGCVIGSVGGGCLTASIIQPNLNLFDSSRADVFRAADDLSLPLDPLVASNNEALFSDIDSAVQSVTDDTPCPADGTTPCTTGSDR